MTQWKQIQTLILDHNYFSTFPKKISGLLSLTTLSLEDNNLHRLQTSTIMRLLDRIASIPNLHTLNLSRNSLFFLSELECTQFIDILAKMKNLKTLNLRKTDLHEFKDQILEKLNHIEDLKIDSRKENHVYFTGQNR